jgi:hypothetical protein
VLPAVPVNCPIIVVPPLTPVPLKKVPETIEPEVIAVTVRTVNEIEPVKTAVFTVTPEVEVRFW